MMAAQRGDSLSLPHPGSLRGAETIPYLNAIYVPGLKPRIGQDLFAPRGPRNAFGTLSDLEWFDHEGFHALLADTTAGRLLRRLVQSLYLLLYSLDEGLTLSAPSFLVRGRPSVSSVTKRVMALYRELKDDVTIVHEAICPVVTLLTLRQLYLQGRIPMSTYEDHVTGLKQRTSRLRSQAHSRDVVARQSMEVAAMLLDLEWLQATSWIELVMVRQTVTALASSCLTVTPRTLQAWWAQGMQPGPQRPAQRLRELVALVSHDRLDPLRRVRRKLGNSRVLFPDAGIITGTMPPPAWMIEQAGEWEEGEPDPLSEMADALGLETPQSRMSNPVLRGISYLDTGALPDDSNAGFLKFLMKLGQAPDGDISQVLVLLTDNTNGERDCRFLARWAGPAPWDIWDRISGGPETEIELGEFPILPAPEEVRLLWGLHQMVNQLLLNNGLSCLCGASPNNVRSCPWRTTLLNACRHVCADGGGSLANSLCPM